MVFRTCESSAGQFEARTRVGWLVGSIPAGDYLGSISHEIRRERNFHGFSMRLSLPDSCSPIVSCSVCLILCQKPSKTYSAMCKYQKKKEPLHPKSYQPCFFSMCFLPGMKRWSETDLVAGKKLLQRCRRCVSCCPVHLSKRLSVCHLKIDEHRRPQTPLLNQHVLNRIASC